MQPVLPATAARLAEWQAQPEVVGVVLVGSRSRGHADALSDDDEDRLFAEGVPRPSDRTALFLELIHLSRAQERARHGLY